MPSIEVDMGHVETGRYGTKLWTQGLATCYGVVAYGLPANNDTQNVNKVMAHVSALSLDHTMAVFLSKVRSSGMRLDGICLSLPDPTYNDGPAKAQEVRAIMAHGKRVPIDQISSQEVSHQQDRSKANILSQSEQIRVYCISLGVPIITHTRNVANEYSAPPYCEMHATASPNGAVSADVHRMEDIPNVPDPVAGPVVTKGQKQGGGGGGGNKHNTPSTGGFSGGGSGGNKHGNMSTGGFSGGHGGGYTNTSTGGPPVGNVHKKSAGGSVRETTSKPPVGDVHKKSAGSSVRETTSKPPGGDVHKKSAGGSASETTRSSTHKATSRR